LLLETPLTFLALFANPLVRPLSKLGMIAVLPSASRAFERRGLTPSHEFFLGCFRQKTASATAANDPVDIFYQLLRQDYVCSLCVHELWPTSMLTVSVISVKTS